MVRPSISSACICLLASATWVSGMSLPVQKKRQSNRSYGSFSTSGKTKVGSLLAAPGGNYSDIGNFDDIRYTTTININGVDVLVALDTGSTDLWVLPPGGIGTFNDTGIPVEVLYGDGTYGVKGTIGVSPFKWGPYTVPEQAFMNAESSTINGVTDIGIHGLFGLGFNDPQASEINGAVVKKYGPEATWGASVLENIFTQNKTTPNFIAIDLARTNDLEEIDGGSFTIGEYDPDFEAVKDSPKLNVYPKDATRWSTLVSGIEINGKAVGLNGYASTPGVPDGSLNALLDTGAPTLGLPKQVIDTIYSAVNGAAYARQFDTWIVPCKESIDLQFVFGDQKIPVHALDISIPQWIYVSGTNYTACTAAFSSFEANTEFDILLGDPFLRNAYTVYDFGDFEDAAGTTTGQAYMQLLAETDATKVAEEVVAARTKTLAGMNPEIPPTDLVRLINQASGTGPDNNSNKAFDALGDSDSAVAKLLDGRLGGVEKYIWVVIGLLSANILIGVLLLVLGCYMCVSRRGKRGSTSTVNILGSKEQRYEPVKIDGY